MVNELKKYSETTFESIKHIDKQGNEFWYARELQEVLEYTNWRRFNETIERAKISCEQSNNIVADHFDADVKIVKAGITTKEIDDYKLSRYACYLIVQNGNPRKKVVALGQTYFAMQTRKQELSEEQFRQLSEDEKRLAIRGNVTETNKALFKTAKDSGVVNFGKFNNAGYKGLYDGETAHDIKKRKGLQKKEDILDHMSSTELAANWFRITQTDEKLKQDKVNSEDKACDTHFIVGKKVRETMIEISNIRPEELPTPKESIKQLEKNKKKLLKNK